jgi:hypothetical protein
MSDQDIWDAINDLRARQARQEAKLDEFQQWLEELAESAKLSANVSVQTIRLIQSQLELVREGRFDGN